MKLFFSHILRILIFGSNTSNPGSGGSTNQQPKPVCGIPTVKSALGNKIVGGNSSNVANHPWFAALAQKQGDSYIVACGATLITSRHLITAAHCYDGNPGEVKETRFLIVFNLQNRCKDKGKLATARLVIVHKNYGKGSQLPENDIAMILLSEPVNNMPICLPSQPSYDNKEGLIIGYGSTKVRSTDGTYPCQLLEAKITIFSKQDCLRSGIGNNFAQKAICAGKMQGGVDACDGDSGGPLMVKVGDKYELLGVTSYGEGCGRKNLPGVYTDLSINGQAKWIQKRLKETGAGDQYTGIDTGATSGQSSGTGTGGQTFPGLPLFPSPFFTKPPRPQHFDLPPHWPGLLNSGMLSQIEIMHHFMDPVNMIDPIQAEMLLL